jgi:hypothetical protein
VVLFASELYALEARDTEVRGFSDGILSNQKAGMGNDVVRIDEIERD